MRILLVNPNTSAETTAALARLARAAAGPDTTIVEATGAFGARLMLSQAEQAIGAHAMLAAAAEHAEGCDAIVVGAFGDYGVAAAAELFDRPAISLADAAFTTLRWLGRPFEIVVLDARLAPALHATAKAHRVEDLLRGVTGVGHAPASAEFAPAAAALVRALDPAVTPCALLVGPPLLAMQESLRAVSRVPLLDPVACAVRLAEAAGRAAAHAGSPAAPLAGDAAGAATGLSAPLTRALALRRQAGG